MSAKNLDKHDRFRCITVGFRVSPEEHETINRIVALSGLTKQEYCYRKCTDREIVTAMSVKNWLLLNAVQSCIPKTIFPMLRLWKQYSLKI